MKAFAIPLGEATIAISGRLLTNGASRARARVSRLDDFVHGILSRSSSIAAFLASDAVRSVSTSQDATSSSFFSSYNGLALHPSSFGFQPPALGLNVTFHRGGKVKSSLSSTSGDHYYWNRDLRRRFLLCEYTSLLPSSPPSSSILSSSQKPRHSGYTTAAINILEPGKHWRGKGWNRPFVELDPEALVDIAERGGLLSPSAQFDAIPDLEQKLKFLETCGLGESQLEQMRKRLPTAVKNTFLKLSLKKLTETAMFLEEEVGVKREDIGNVLFANPFIAGSSMDDCLRPKVAFLRNRGISREQMGKMVIRSPQFLTYSMEGKLLAIEQKLLEVGLKADEIGRVFVKYPAVFGTSIRKFDKNVQSLRDSGIAEVAKAIFKIPQIMSLSLDNKFETIVEYLHDELKLQQEQITKVLSCQISILSFSVQENIRPKVSYFAEMGLQQDDIARLVVKYPNLFCHSLDNSIKPKVQYLMKVMNLQVLELLSFPHYLSYSLPGRIIPRHEYVIKHGFNFRLSSLLSCCDRVFQKRYPKP